jgi:hypothetical protein
MHIRNGLIFVGKARSLLSHFNSVRSYTRIDSLVAFLANIRIG